MYPAPIALPDELGKPNLPLLLHLSDEVEQATVVGLRACNQVCRATQHVVTVLRAAHERIQLLTSIAAADYDRCSPRLTYGVEKLLNQYMQQVICTRWWAVVDALALRRGAGGKFGNGKIGRPPP